MLPPPQQHQKSPGSARRSTLLAALGGAAVGLVGFLIVVFFLPPSIDAALEAAVDNSNGAVVLIGCLLILIGTLALHELGHIVGGLLVGFRFALYIVGPLMLVREGEQIRVRLNRSLALYGGLAATTPTGSHNLIARMAWMVAAGPLASLLLTLIGVSGALLVDPRTASNAWLLALITALSGFFNLLAVTVPARTGGFLTDRARWQLLQRGGAPAERVAAAAALQAQLLTGISAADWPAGLVATAIGPADGSIDHLLGRIVFGHSHALARNDQTTARGHIAAALADIDRLPTPLHPMVYLEAAHLAALGGDPVDAHAWQALAAASPLIDALTRQRVAAAVALADGDYAQAATLVEIALADAARRADLESASEKALLLQLKTMIDQTSADKAD